MCVMKKRVKVEDEKEMRAEGIDVILSIIAPYEATYTHK
jgi:hypothetical protein